MAPIKAWIHAARLRTLPLSLSCIAMGAILAKIDGYINIKSLILAVIVTILLQILSNYANDYGDFETGVDTQGRIGPSRALQSGMITKDEMERGLVILTIITLVLGIFLLKVSQISMGSKFLLLIMGIAAIAAAFTYTMGKNPYGYKGLGDTAVFIFFGLLGVLGSYWIIHGSFNPYNILMASTIGLFATGVLNLNNIRDLEADKVHGKNTIPVIIGYKMATKYHALLLITAWILTIIYTFIQSDGWKSWTFILSAPLFIYNWKSLSTRKNEEIDPLLKQLAIATLIFVLLFGLVRIW